MTLVQMVPIALQISIALIVIGLGMETGPADFTWLLRRPSLLVRSVLAMNVIMPLLAAAAVAVFHLLPELKLALVVLAVSPVPPVLPVKQGKAGGNMSYAVGLLAVSAVVSIIAIPASVALIEHSFGREAVVPMALIAQTVGLSVLAPLVIGLAIHAMASGFAERAAKPLSLVGTVLLAVAFLPVVIGSWRMVVAEVGHGTLMAIASFTVAGLLVGHLLGGPEPEDRTVLGLSTAARHPGVAIAVAGAIAPDMKTVAAAVLLCVIVSSLVTMPYVNSRKRAAATVAARTA